MDEAETVRRGAGESRGARGAEATAGQPPAIEIDGLTKVYPGGSRAVDHVSLAVPAGQVFGFLGPNGAGKTTTIKILAGLLTATGGHARLNGYDVARDRSAAMEQFGAVLESSRNVYWTLSAWRNLMYFGRLKGMRTREIRPRAEELLSGLGLWERRNEKVGGFSRGMQQKVSVTAALIADPPIVLLDEPTVGLDVEATRTVQEWITALSGERGKTVLLTTHQMEVVQKLCDRVAVIRHGRIVADLPTGELLARFRQRDRYEIRIEGGLGSLALPAGFTASAGDGATVVRGRVGGPAELYRLVDIIRDSGAELVSIAQVQPSMEDVFLDLVREGSDD